MLLAAISFDRPIALSAALAIVAAIIAIFSFRRLSARRAWMIPAILGLCVLALAAGSPNLNGASAGDVLVMVDLSPSTRGAAYRDSETLNRRLALLLGDTPHRVFNFGEGATKTEFAPPRSDAIVLFSDGRFDLPAFAPPTFAAIDPTLESANDAAVTALSMRGDDVRIVVRNAGVDRTLETRNLLPSPALQNGEHLGIGTQIFHAARDPSASEISVKINGADAWPENDAMTIAPPPPVRAAKWWVTSREGPRDPPDSSWTMIRADSLPTDVVGYLVPAIIALDDVPIEALSRGMQQRLEQYVRDLGGTVLLIGGEHAFGAGGYAGSGIDAISPLASAPPAPTRQWLFLIDASGSMAAAAKGKPRFAFAVDAMRDALPRVPPNDLVSVATFARDVRWWGVAQSASDVIAQLGAIEQISPNGPTNLQPAIEGALARIVGSSSLPAEVVIVTDADATVADTTDLGRRFVAARARVHLLASNVGESNSALASLVTATGGQMTGEADVARWNSRLREFVRAAMPEPLVSEAATVNFAASCDLPARLINTRNRGWPRAGIEVIARASDETIAAIHQVGSGRVCALAFRATSTEVEAIARECAQSPRDPRFSISWEFGSICRVNIDAIDDGRAIDDLQISLRRINSSESIPVPQIAPGRYALSLASQRDASVVTIHLGDRILDRAALPARYAPEFDAIGNDRAALRTLASRTGGRLIEPDDAARIEFSMRTRRIDLTSTLASVGVVLIAASIIWWRRIT